MSVHSTSIYIAYRPTGNHIRLYSRHNINHTHPIISISIAIATSIMIIGTIAIGILFMIEGSRNRIQHPYNIINNNININININNIIIIIIIMHRYCSNTTYRQSITPKTMTNSNQSACSNK